MSKYKELNDKEWLREKYIIQLLSLIQISKILNCNNNSVRQALIKHGFEIRNSSQAQTINRSFDLSINNSVLDGSLMGDASLHKWRKGNKSLPHLKKKSKHLDHLEWFSKTFEESPNIQFVEQYLKATQKTYTYHTFRTKVDDKLQSFYERWYPESNDYKKVIPDDIEINETFLLHWFLDDGYSHLRNRTNEYLKIGKGWTSKTDQVTVGFCTECFELDQQERLCDKINEVFDLGIKTHKIVWKNSKESKEGYRLMLPQLNANKFFEILGDCPVPSLQYKWKITNNIKN